MKKDYTHITVVLDRSGSMGSVESDVIGGYNQFIEKQKEVKGEVTVTLVIFDTNYEVVYNAKSLNEVPTLDNKVYYARGMTALNDAIGKAINETGAALRDMDEKDRPEKVVFVVYTDGFENSSREFSKENIKKMAEEQTNKWKWQFIFMGANIDSFGESANYGMHDKKNTLNFNSVNTQGIKCSFSALTSNVLRGRTTGTYGYTDEEIASNKPDTD